MPTGVYIDTLTGARTETEIDFIAPSAPSSLIATALSDTEIELTWVAASDNFGVAGYSVYNVTSGDAFVADVSGETVTYIVTFFDAANQIPLTPSTMYSFNVDATDVAGNVSARSNSASATTDA